MLPTMRIRRTLTAVFALAGAALIGVYFYMRVEHFPRNRIHDIWMIGMLCCWISVFAAWRERANKDS